MISAERVLQLRIRKSLKDKFDSDNLFLNLWQKLKKFFPLFAIFMQLNNYRFSIVCRKMRVDTWKCCELCAPHSTNFSGLPEALLWMFLPLWMMEQMFPDVTVYDIKL